MMAEASTMSLPDDVRVRVGGHDDLFTTHGNQDVAHGCQDIPGAEEYNNVFTNGYRKYNAESESSEEDTFPRGAKLSTSSAEENEVVKPLMYPRQRPKLHVSRHKRTMCNQVMLPVVYFLLFIGSLATFACLIIYFVNNYGNQWLPGDKNVSSSVIGCSHLEVEDVWVKGIPKLMTESSFRLLDVNKDGVLDILFGFATGAEGYNVPSLVCDIYFGGQKPCLGGLLALDGASGQELWRHYSPHEIFAVTCEEDLSGDGQPDCVVAGRVGIMEAVDTVNGHLLWNFTHTSERVDIMNLYTAQFVGDLDGDGVSDLLNIHGGDPFGEPGSETRLGGKLLLFSGKDGSLLQSVPVPDGRESYYSPVLYQRGEGTSVVLFGTGGETHPGALWYISLRDLYKGRIDKAQQIYYNKRKGIMTPPVLLDLNKDGVEDIVMATYNSTVLAFDGDTYQLMWNFTYPMSETYATPAPGYFNDDDTPDFMVHWQYGPGFPVYYHAVSTVVDGRTGESLLQPFVKSSVGAQSSPLSVSVEGQGNDLFVYWMADCMGSEGKGGEYKFVKGTNVHEKSRSDVCRLRFKTAGVSRLMALNSHIKPPGHLVYESAQRYHEEHSAWVNTSAEAQRFLQEHPEYTDNFQVWQDWIEQQSAKTKEMYMANIKGKPSVSHHGKKHNEATGSFMPYGDVSAHNDYSDSYNNDNSDYSNLNMDNIPWSMRESQGRYQSSVPPDRDYSEQMPSNFDEWKNILGDKDPELLDQVSSILAEAYRKGEANSKFGDVEATPSRPDLNKASAAYRPRKPTSGRVSGANFGAASSTYYPVMSGVQRDRYPHMEGGRKKKPPPLSVERGWEGRGRSREAAHGSRAHPTREKGYNWGKTRRKRHVGPHDEGGLQRLISTGTLAPSLLPTSDPMHPHSMDVLFATYWFYPAKTRVLLPEDQECIDTKMANQNERFDPNSKYFGMDDDGYGHAVEDECLEQSKHQMPKHGTYHSQGHYNPYHLNMGQLTIYRLRLKCTCGALKSSEGQCSRMLPFQHQQWPGYMGAHADSHWKPRPRDPWARGTQDAG